MVSVDHRNLQLVAALATPPQQVAHDGLDLSNPDSLNNVVTQVQYWSGGAHPTAKFAKLLAERAFPLLNASHPDGERDMPKGFIAELAFVRFMNEGSSDLIVFHTWATQQHLDDAMASRMNPAAQHAATALGVDMGTPVTVDAHLISLMSPSTGAHFVAAVV